MYLKLLRALSSLGVTMLFHGIPGAVPLLRWTTEARLGRVLGQKVHVEIFVRSRKPLSPSAQAFTDACGAPDPKED